MDIKSTPSPLPCVSEGERENIFCFITAIKQCAAVKMLETEGNLHVVCTESVINKREEQKKYSSAKHGKAGQKDKAENAQTLSKRHTMNRHGSREMRTI